MDEKSSDNGIVNRAVDRLFSMDKASIYLLIIVFLGFILRIIAAINLTVSADDMHFTIHAIDFLKSGKLVVYDQSASLWYYLTDIFYNIFGINQFASRFSAVLFGTLSIIVIFFLTKEFFNGKIALIASFLLAVSPFHIKNTIAEMDVTVMFFVMFSMLMFIKGLKSEKNKFFIFSGLLLGIAVFTKVYVLLFIPVSLAYAIYKNKVDKKEYIDKKLLKKLFIFLVFVSVFTIPSLTHNYLLYKDKGFMDFIYTNALGIGKETATQYYSWDTGFGDKADWRGFFLGKSKHNGYSATPTSIQALSIVYYTDPIVFVLGIIGLIFCFFRKKDYFMYFVFILIFVFFYLASRILLPKHYIFLLVALVPAAAYLISLIDEKIRIKIDKFRLRYIIILIFIITLALLGLKTQSALGHFYAKSEVAQVIDYKNAEIPKESLVVADSRIYRGEIHWILNGRNYVEASYFPQLIEASEKSQSILKVPLDVYFLECVIDDCGWGTIKDQPDFNKSMEQMVSFFENTTKKEKDFFTARGKEYYYPIISEKDNLYYRLYHGTMIIDPDVLRQLKKLNVWFLYPIGYDKSIAPIFDEYTIHTSFGKLLDKIAHIIVYIAIFLAFAAVFGAIYLIFDQR